MISLVTCNILCISLYVPKVCTLTTAPSLRQIFCSSHIFYFGFWYFGNFSCVIFFLVFFRLAHLALQNVNKDYVIFLYFRNFVAKSDQKQKTKNEMNETNEKTSDECDEAIFFEKLSKFK